MKTVFSAFLFSTLFLLAACGGGSSSSDGGGDPGDPPTADPTIPQSIAGTYSGTYEGSGRDVSGVYTCEGTFVLEISQSGTTITVTFAVTSSGGSSTARCTEAFSVSSNGTYNSNSGALSILTVIGEITASVTGTASELNGKITLAGNWSTTNTSSAAVIASGTWTAESE